jgi:hypothetical protein
MENLKKYLKYYFLEDYLFNEISNNFQTNHFLTDEEFFAIVIWKRNASKTKIKKELIKKNKSINGLTTEIYKAQTPQEKLNILISIPQIGISIASAILTVCYKNDFTILDYRAINSLIKLGANVNKDILKYTSESYFDYLNKCKELQQKSTYSLRDFDRILWAMDWYDGKDGLKQLCG